MLIFPSLAEKLGFIEFAMRCASSMVLVGMLLLAIISISFFHKKLKVYYRYLGRKEAQ